jgi:hypothetical protein
MAILSLGELRFDQLARSQPLQRSQLKIAELILLNVAWPDRPSSTMGGRSAPPIGDRTALTEIACVTSTSRNDITQSLDSCPRMNFWHFVVDLRL